MDSGKYDRQLRIWGHKGQARLTSSTVCVIGGESAIGTELLKNLILPQCGKVWLGVDQPTDRDVLATTCFFSGSQWREQLASLNPDVPIVAAYPLAIGELPGRQTKRVKVSPSPTSGSVGSLGVPADQEPTSFVVRAMLADRTPGTTAAVVLINQRASELAKVQAILTDVTDVFVVSIRGTEFVGRYDLTLPRECPIVDVHRESDRLDLRIGDPFPSLHDAALEACASLASLNDHEHAHVPWPYLLVWASAQWREASGSAEMPKSSDERSAVRAMVQAVARSPAQENVAEAVANVHRLWNVGVVPSTARDAMAAALRLVRSGNLPAHEEDARWWLLAASVGLFVDRTGHLPLSPSLPDVTATSAGYARLQRLYSARAAAEAHEVFQLLQTLRNDEAPSAPDVSYDDVLAFCANAHSIGVTTLRSREAADAAAAAQLGDTTSLAHLYFALGACDTVEDSTGDDALAQLQRAANQRARAAGGTADVSAEAVQRVARGGGAVPHVLGALMGGIVSQEMIKLFTRQFVPVTSTLVYDGASGNTLTI